MITIGITILFIYSTDSRISHVLKKVSSVLISFVSLGKEWPILEKKKKRNEIEMMDKSDSYRGAHIVNRKMLASQEKREKT